jgi:hypothetical protein
MNCFAHCEFSNFVGSQPELIEFNKQLLIIQNHKELIKKILMKILLALIIIKTFVML